MGLIQKKDEEREVIEGIEVIESGDTPDDLPMTDYDLVGGKSAEDIAADADDDDAEGAEPSAAGRHARPKDASDGDAASGGHDDGGQGRRGPGAAFIAIAVVAVIVAGIAGYFVGSGGFAAGGGADSATLTEDQLDTVVAHYTYNGASHDITAREVMESQYSLDAYEQEDGTYPTPSADGILNYIRTQIMLTEADTRGIEVSDDEMAEYAESSIGTSDYATMAEQYQLSENQAREVVRQNATLQKLYEQIMPENELVEPEAPTEPEDGDTSTRSQDYADYIIALAGDEWDAEKGDWASEDGIYAQALSGTDFSADSASYEEALLAYYAAYQAYAEDNSAYSSTWTDFQNTLFANANVDLYGLYA